MKQKQKKSLIKLAIQFVKLNLAGNILFWGTYGGFFLLYEIFGLPEVASLAVASIIAHVFFFIADKKWVFNGENGNQKTSDQVWRFVAFMGLNYFINLGIILSLSAYFGISPYIGQFISAMFFVIWNFVGLKFWVFQEPIPYALRFLTARKDDERRRTTK